MWKYLSTTFLLTLFLACQENDQHVDFTSVEFQEIYTDSLSIRAIELTKDQLFFACNKGTYGFVDLKNHEVVKRTQMHEGTFPEFRAVAHTDSDLFMLSVANPALLYKMLLRSLKAGCIFPDFSGSGNRTIGPDR